MYAKQLYLLFLYVFCGEKNHRGPMKVFSQVESEVIYLAT